MTGGRIALLRPTLLAFAAAFSVFLLSYTNGGFDGATRAYGAIAAWWLIGVGAALGLATTRARVSRLALAAPALLALFALWSLISLSWAPDGERAFEQFNQISLYVAAFVLSIVVARLVPASVLVGGISLALTGIGVVALVSRVFPSSFPGSVRSSAILHPLGYRLSFPLGYWNGLGIELALALPLLLSIMVSRRNRLASALAALPLPVIAADMYLTSSRGAFAAAAVGVVAYLILTSGRWAALAAAVVAGASGVLTIYVVHGRRELVNGQLNATGIHQGHVVALAIALIAIATALAWSAACELGRRLPAPPRGVGLGMTIGLVVAAIVGVVLAHPVRHFQEFKSIGNASSGSSEYVTSHLLSTSGNGRWQFWSAAISEFRAHPLNGGGAGSWEFWWLRHRPIALFSQFAHSFYLEALGELGVVGLLLLAGAVLVAVAGAVRAAVLLRSPEVAGAAACGVAFFFAAAYDWVWQLTGIGIVGVGALGLALGALPSRRATPRVRPWLVRLGLPLLAVAAIVPQVVALGAAVHLQNSQAADAAGNLSRATSEALAAKEVEPWASRPYLQLGLIAVQKGDLAEGRALIGSAIKRSPQDWTLWLRAAQIDVQRGAILAGRRELGVARTLDPLLQVGSS